MYLHFAKLVLGGCIHHMHIVTIKLDLAEMNKSVCSKFISLLIKSKFQSNGLNQPDEATTTMAKWTLGQPMTK